MAEQQQRDDILNSVASVPEHVVFRSFEAETLLLNLETGQYHGLNPTGGRLLELLAQNNGDMETATGLLAEEFDVEPGEIEDDLLTFCADLAERGLIVLGDPPATSED